MVREGSRRFEGVEPLGNSVQVPYTTCSHCEDEVREGSVQSNHSELIKDFYTPCFLCTEVVQRMFEGVEPLGNSVQVPYTPCSHCVDEVREGSVQSNHSELTSKTSTHLAFSALKWFEKVRGGSRGLNHSETVYRYPTLREDEVREGSVQSIICSVVVYLQDSETSSLAAYYMETLMSIEDF